MLLEHAIKVRDVAAVKEILQSHPEQANQLITESPQVFPILIALQHLIAAAHPADQLKSAAIVSSLKDAGLDCNSVIAYQTPLNQAVQLYPHLVEILLKEYGAKAEVSGAISPLWLAAIDDKVMLFELLLEYGASPKQVDGTGLSPIQRACEWPEELKLPKCIASLQAQASAPRSALIVSTNMAQAVHPMPARSGVFDLPITPE